jgi:hypothetical protein
MQDFVDVGPVNAVHLRPGCLASGFLDLDPEQFDKVVPLKNAHVPHLYFSICRGFLARR